MLTLALLATYAPSAGATQSVPNGAYRVNAATNEQIGIDGVDDYRVDADIAVIDVGVDLSNPDLNAMAGVDCMGATAPSYVCTPGPGGGDWAPGHGTGVALALAALDNDYGGVGIAPGARIWSVRAGEQKMVEEIVENRDKFLKGEPWTSPQTSLEPMIAAARWVAENASKFEVLHFAGYCTTDPTPDTPQPVCIDEAVGGGKTQTDLLYEALQEAIDKGVVLVTPAGNNHREISGQESDSIPSSMANSITVSAIADTDGKPGGKGEAGEPCNAAHMFFGLGLKEKDATNADSSHYGAGIDVAAPGPCTSGAAPHASGAAAILASMKNPENATEVGEIRATILAEGNTNSSAHPTDPGWDDNSGDGFKEPLVDLEDEVIFDPPETFPGADVPAVDSDVNGDGYADLVTMRADGVVYVHRGSEAGTFDSGEASFKSSPLNPAQYDGSGHYVIDVADVAGFMGEKRADLVTLTDDGDVHVYAGTEGAKFDETGVTSELGLTPGLLDAGGFEPIAVADVDGDGPADLIAYDDAANKVVVYRGQSDGSFGPAAVAAQSGIDSALHTGTGHYFVDAADVTGDNRADLVAMHEGALKVFAGEPSGTFAAPVVSHSASIDPAMDDGSGYEPVGLGDVTKDGHADLALVKSGTVYLYPGSNAGSFGTVATSFAGIASSTTFGGGVVEMLGLFDVNGSGNADIVGALPNNSNKARVYMGQGSGVFETSVTTASPTFPSTQHFKNQTSEGNEFVAEKPSWRRRGCDAAGCGWVTKSVPNAAGAADSRLTDVSCTTSTFCMATGNQVSAGISYAYTRTWTGSAWAEGPGTLPENAGVEVNGVSCTSSTACTVVGHETNAKGEVFTYAARWNGSSWTRQSVPNAAGVANNRLTDISCTTSTFCMATGHMTGSEGLTWAFGRTWNGSTWSSVGGVPFQENSGVELRGVSCTSSTACTVVGHETEANGDVLTLAVRWNGSSWTRQSVPNAAGGANNRLTDVSCVSATFCLATGYLTAGTTYAFGRTWDGSAWSKTTGSFDNTGTILSGVSCTSVTSCTAVGQEIEENGDVLTLSTYWDGANWLGRQETPNPAGATDSRLVGVSCVFPRCTAVGSYTSASGTANLAEHTP